MICQNKRAIRTHEVFDGLAVNDRNLLTRKFMQPNFYLVEIPMNGRKAFVVFEVLNKTFVFHLVNFTKFKTRDMTETFMREFVEPFCKFRGLEFIRATAEREGMARKLKKLGFSYQSGDYVRSV